MMDDMAYMRLAMREASLAAEADEVPVGALLVRACDGEVIAAAHNRRETEKNALAHAELLVIAEGCRKLGGWRLLGCTLYVTLEPCPMCAGAVVNARIPRIVFGAKDPKAGAFGSLLNLNFYPLNFKPQLTGGILADECAAQLREFFIQKRKRK